MALEEYLELDWLDHKAQLVAKREGPQTLHFTHGFAEADEIGLCLMRQLARLCCCVGGPPASAGGHCTVHPGEQ